MIIARDINTSNGVVPYDPELIQMWPDRPVLINEVPIIRIDNGTILIAGLRQVFAIKGRNILVRFHQLISNLDGSSTVDEILESSGDVNGTFRILSTLIQAGAIEEYRSERICSSHHGTSNMIARMSQTTGWNSSQSDVLLRTERLSVSVVAPSTVRSDFVPLLLDVGLKESASEDVEKRYILCSGEYTDTLLDPNAYSEDTTVVLFSCNEDFCRLGPLFKIQQASRFEHAFKQYNSYSQDGGSYRSITGMSLLAHYIFCYVSRLVSFPLYRKIYEFCWQDGFKLDQFIVGDIGIYQANKITPRELRVDKISTLDELCSTVEMPPKFEIPPSAHLWHYDAKNINLSKRTPPRLGSATRISLSTMSQSNNFGLGEDSNNLQLLSKVLFYCAGLYKKEVGLSRVAPSGGNIGAVEVFVQLSTKYRGPNGIYRYNAEDQILELVSEMVQVSDVDEVILHFVGNINLIESKYGAYAYHLLNYDVGVMKQYLHLVTNAIRVSLSWGRSEDFQSGLWIPEATSSFLHCDAAKLSFEKDLRSKSTVGSSMTETWLQSLVFLRYACREFGITKDFKSASTLLLRAFEHDQILKEEDKSSLTVEYLLICSGMTCYNGVYKSRTGRCIQMTEISQDFDGGMLMNQTVLGHSPFKIVPWFRYPKESAVLRHEEFSLLLQRVARVISQAWLELSEFDYVGTAAGGPIRSEIENFLPMQYVGGVPLLSLCFGAEAK